MSDFDITPLAILKQRGIALHNIIDVGAAWGNWTREVQQIYPQANYLCIEPRLECKNALEALPGHVYVETALVGACEGETEFNVHDLQSSVYRNTRGERYGGLSVMPVTTLDRIIEKWFLDEAAIQPPDYVKIDVQGGEIEVVKGLHRTIASYKAPIIQLELNLHRFYSGIPLAHEVIVYMASIGYVLWDLVDPLRRTLDNALGNIDGVFVPEGSELRSNPRWGWGSFS